MEAYVRELKSMNCLIDDTIHAGNYLTVTYYKGRTGRLLVTVHTVVFCEVFSCVFLHENPELHGATR